MATTAVSRPSAALAPGTRVALWLSALIVPLAAVAAAGGLLIPGLYRNPAAIIPAMQGQDLITLLVLPVLVAALRGALHGSARATLVWLGLLGYICYTYTGAGFAYYFNSFNLIYIALFSLSVFALATAAAGMDAPAIERRFDAATPRRPVAVFLTLIALMLGALELGQNLQYLATGELPAGVVAAGSTAYFVYVLDLGLIVPLCFLAAFWLWRRRPWGGILAAVMLGKSAAMGLALLAMGWFALAAGLPSDGLEGLWALIAAGGLGLGLWLLRHCREGS